MTNNRLNQLNDEIDLAIPALLLPLRSKKVIDQIALKKVKALLDELDQTMGSENEIPKRLAGRVWFLFTAILTEAEYAKNREEIEIVAWSIQEKLRRIFGPIL